MQTLEIHLHNDLHTASLVTRQTATELARFIDNMEAAAIDIDFTDIQFASRSFFDQLYYHLEELKKAGKAIQLLNMTLALEQLYQLVVNANQAPISMSHTDIDEIEAAKVVTI